MEPFVNELVTEVATTSVQFLDEVVDTYWLTILSVLFVGFMIGLFWRLAYKIFGRRK